MPILVIIGGGVGVGLPILLFLTVFVGYPAFSLVCAPFVAVYHWIVYPPQEVQNTYLQPVLEEVVKTPYEELPTKDAKGYQFIMTVNGKQILCTYGQDNTWSTGTQKPVFNKETLEMDYGVVRGAYHEDLARKVFVRIKPYKAPEDKGEAEDDFHEFEKIYAAVPSGEWYCLVPFEDYEKERGPQQVKDTEAKARALSEKHEREQMEKAMEEDKKIRRAN